MTTYRIEADRSLCSGFGSCVDALATHFALDDSGLASMLVTETDDARESTASCRAEWFPGPAGRFPTTRCSSRSEPSPYFWSDQSGFACRW